MLCQLSYSRIALRDKDSNFLSLRKILFFTNAAEKMAATTANAVGIDIGGGFWPYCWRTNFTFWWFCLQRNTAL